MVDTTWTAMLRTTQSDADALVHARVLPLGVCGHGALDCRVLESAVLLGLQLRT